MLEPLDQPLPQSQPKPANPTWVIIRNLITLLLFPMALLRLRVADLSPWELVKGGLFASLQYLIAACLFILLRKWWFRIRKRPQKTEYFIILLLATAVDLVIVVGIFQIIQLWWHF